MILSDHRVEELYASIYEINVFSHNYKYAIQSLLIIEEVEKELKGVTAADDIVDVKLENLQHVLTIKKDFFNLVLRYKKQELDIFMAMIIAFIVLIYGFYNFSGLFN